MMISEKNKKFVDEIAKDLRPVRFVRPELRVVVAIVLAALYGFVVLRFLGPRAALGYRLTSLSSLASLMGGFFIVAGSLILAIYHSIPGRSVGRLPKLTIIGGAALLVMGTLSDSPELTWADHFQYGFARTGSSCASTVIAISLVPALGFFLALRSLAPMRPRVAALRAGLSAGAVGVIALSFHCPIDEWLHLFTWHYLPVIFVVIAAGFFGTKFLRW